MKCVSGGRLMSYALKTHTHLHTRLDLRTLIVQFHPFVPLLLSVSHKEFKCVASLAARPLAGAVLSELRTGRQNNQKGGAAAGR